MRLLGTAFFLFLTTVAFAGCAGGSSPAVPIVAAAVADDRATAQQSISNGPAKRPAFLGAFFRAVGPVPYGVFALNSPGQNPAPYPVPSGKLFGANSYCDGVASNGYSISTGHLVDPVKLQNIMALGVGWTRLTASQFFDDDTHIFGPGAYSWGDLDSAQCSVLRHNINPVIGLEAGPVMYDAVPGTFSPIQVPTYETAADFGAYCGAVAQHEVATFSAVTKYSIPGNEVNSNPAMFPGGEAQIASYMIACYRAIKAVQPSATVYGFELNMVAGINPAAFVGRLYALGCRPGLCYDRLALHLELAYPIPAPTAPCFPNPGGTYSLQCIVDVQTAAHAKLQTLISETVYTVPGSVPDEATKAAATVAAFKAFATDTYVDGVSYANVDECALYSSGFFFDGCLIDQQNTKLPAFAALQSLAQANYSY
jgi:hypothetical protein